MIGELFSRFLGDRTLAAISGIITALGMGGTPDFARNLAA
jgi:hypothetical protein